MNYSKWQLTTRRRFLDLHEPEHPDLTSPDITIRPINVLNGFGHWIDPD
jgi:hypothetical protein